MLAQGQDNGLTIHCQVEPTPNGYQLVGSFHAELTISDGNSDHNSCSELDQIEKQIGQIGQIGQQIQRELCRHTFFEWLVISG